MQALNDYIWNYSSFIRCQNFKRFCFSYNLSAFASRFQHSCILALRKCSGKKVTLPPPPPKKAEGARTPMLKSHQARLFFSTREKCRKHEPKAIIAKYLECYVTVQYVIVGDGVWLNGYYSELPSKQFGIKPWQERKISRCISPVIVHGPGQVLSTTHGEKM